MDALLIRGVQRAFQAAAAEQERQSPLWAALCRGLAAEPGPALLDLCARYFRITAVTAPPAAGTAVALHALALMGLAPALAALLPSCGGAWSGAERDLALAAEQALQENLDEALDFLLSRLPARPDPQAAAPLALGLLAVSDRFAGGVSLVELGSEGGLPLLVDQYAYAMGGVVFGSGSLRLELEMEGNRPAWAGGDLPQVVGRVGLGAAPTDLRAESERLALQAFLAPDHPAAHERFRAATDLVAAKVGLDLRAGEPAAELAPLLLEAYAAMPQGNTLVLFDVGGWESLSDPEQRQAALAVQLLASRLEQEKPLAWVQVERFLPGRPPELRLHTFGWADPEDRTVQRLAEFSSDFGRGRWLG